MGLVHSLAAKSAANVGGNTLVDAPQAAFLLRL